MPTIKIHNVETNEIVEREMTSEEIAQMQKDQIILDEIKKVHQETKAAREAAEIKLAALGLSVDDLKALGLG